ncbi:MAG: gamma-glutamylcyclotransferase [Pseudomonadota bacterium]
MITVPDFSDFSLERPRISELPRPDGEFWVFGYGSLMWDPGFRVIESSAATLKGFQRRLCLWSVRYRGTPGNPGLVLGLDAGEQCDGYAFHVAPIDIESVCDYLLDREMLSNAYVPTVAPISLRSDNRLVNALTFVSKHDHPQYAPAMTPQEIVSIITVARGERGANTDYVVNTANHLNELRIFDPAIHDVCELLDSNERKT